MNQALAIQAGLAFENDRPLEGVLAFLASRSKKSARELSEPAGEVFKGVAGILDQFLTTAIEKRTAAEFRAAFGDLFPKYAAMTLALSRFASAIVPPDVVDRLTRESICELEADFREKALPAFGAVARDQAMFTIWTLRKINDLVSQIYATKLDESKQKEDGEYSSQFNICALSAHFSLDCLNMALQLNRPIYPEVMSELIDGLRSMVNAYAWARRGLALRVSSAEHSVEENISDEEDEVFVKASMLNLAELGEDAPPRNAT